VLFPVLGDTFMNNYLVMCVCVSVFIYQLTCAFISLGLKPQSRIFGLRGKNVFHIRNCSNRLRNFVVALEVI
jgi:hypothetical protein